MRFEIGRSGIGPILETWKRAEITDFSGWFSLFCVFLSQLTGQDDLIAGINTSGRMQEELERVVGMFVKTLPIRCRISPDISFFDFSKEIHHYLVQAVGRQIYDLSDIRRALNSSRGESVGNLISAMFVYLDFGIPGLAGDNVLFVSKESDNSSSKYPLTLFANGGAEFFEFRLEYSFAFFSAADAGLLIRQFQALVTAIAKNPGRKVFEYLGTDLPSSYAIEDTISFNF
jgi:non-ribosomal peptide synthetase component F